MLSVLSEMETPIKLVAYSEEAEEEDGIGKDVEVID